MTLTLGAASPTLLGLTAALSAAVATASAAAGLDRSGPARPPRPGCPHLRATQSKGVCLAEVRYADGAVQDSGVKTPSGRRVSWTIRVPNNAMLGSPAGPFAAASPATHRHAGASVTAPRSASTAPHVMIDKQGYSQRNDQYGDGSSVSYGLLLKNISTTQDAKDVYLLINFVDRERRADRHGDEEPSTLIPAGGRSRSATSMQMRTQVPVVEARGDDQGDRHTSRRRRASCRTSSTSAILPSETDPGWVGEVDGEIVNDTSPQTLTFAKLSIVLLDATGKIVGGGTAIDVRRRSRPARAWSSSRTPASRRSRRSRP